MVLDSRETATQTPARTRVIEKWLLFPKNLGKVIRIVKVEVIPSTPPPPARVLAAVLKNKRDY